MRADMGTMDARFEATANKADELMARLAASRDPTRPALVNFALPDASHSHTLHPRVSVPYRSIAARRATEDEDEHATSSTVAAIRPSSFTQAHAAPRGTAARPAAVPSKHDAGASPPVRYQPLCCTPAP